MALVLADRVQETTTTFGTGLITLAGAAPGFQSFAVVGNGNTCYYTIIDNTAWEVGIGTYSTSGPSISRTTILSNSNGNTSPITLGAGSKTVFLTYPAGKSVNLDASNNLVLANGATIQGLTVGKGASAVSTNTALGVTALEAITSGGNATGIGNEALRRVTTASNNTGVGGFALSFANTGNNNTAVGYQSGYSLTGGSESVFVGVFAGGAVTTAINSTAVGYYSLSQNVTGADNTALGNIAAQTVTGAQNTALGSNAMRLGTSGSNNTATGHQAGYRTSGSLNTFYGKDSGFAMTTGSNNTIVGSYTGNSGALDMRTLNNHAVLSDGSGNIKLVVNAAGAYGVNGANYGTSGQVLTSNGSGATPTWQAASGGVSQAKATAISLIFGL